MINIAEYFVKLLDVLEKDVKDRECSFNKKDRDNVISFFCEQYKKAAKKQKH